MIMADNPIVLTLGKRDQICILESNYDVKTNLLINLFL